ncbi:MAG: response regulator [Acidimicrobiales bacterium]
MEVVGPAATVVEMHRLVSSRRPHVVLMDYALPDGDGVAATALIKAEHPEVKVVVLTSFVDEDVPVGAIEAGCSGYVTKAKSGDELTTAVRLAAEGEALVSADMLARLLPRLRRSHRGVGADLSARSGRCSTSSPTACPRRRSPSAWCCSPTPCATTSRTCW